MIFIILSICTAFKLELSTSLSRAQIINYNQIQYSAYLSIGYPAQHFKLLIDTGSYMLWIPSSLSECQKCSKFDESKSESFKSINKDSSLNYMKGSVNGRLCKDWIKIGEKTSNNTEFLLADEIHDFNYLQADGILGLGYNGDENLKNSLIFNLFQEFQIESPVFAVNFNNLNEKSYLLIGEYEKEKFGDGKKVKVFQDFYSWSGRLEKIAFGEIEINDYNTVFFDTGMSFFTGPKEEISAIFQLLEEILKDCVQDNYLTCTCAEKDINVLPVFKLFIDGHEFQVFPENYLIFSQGTCIFLLASSSSQNWGAGMGFFREYYSVFNYSAASITFFSKRLSKSSLSEEISEDSARYSLVPFLLASTSLGILCYTLRKSKQPEDYSNISSSGYL